MQQSSAIPLSAFLGVVEDSVYQVFGERRFWVIAETADVKVYRDRFYAFLNLIEKQGSEVVASAGAALWRTSFGKIAQFEKITGVKFENNLKLVLQISVSYNAKYGFRLVIHDVDTAYTIGQLSQQREQILESLAQKHPKLVWKIDDNYVSANQFLPRLSVYNNIALIAAPNSDGYRDFVHELENNPWRLKFNITLFPVPVQGDNAAPEMVKAIVEANSVNNCQAIILVRGGGSQTDFSPYDSYELSLAVAGSKLPVFTGIGHERNVSIVDELAFAQLKTPTKCAAYLVEWNYKVVVDLLSAKTHLLHSAQKMIVQKRNTVNSYRGQIAKSALWMVVSQKQKVMHQLQKLQLLQPTKTVQRGYSLLRKEGKIIESIQGVQEGDAVVIQLKDGTINAQVIHKN
ncbi:MAG: exodeoxyribonuclease VII large subunit [Bacteroidota bacterium]